MTNFLPALPMANSVLSRRWGRDAVAEAEAVLVAGTAIMGTHWRP